MGEYHFDYVAPMHSGRVVFKVTNGGRLQHELVLVPLPSDFPVIKPAHHHESGTYVALPTIAILPPIAPGETGTFAVDLPPGRYGMFCFVKDGDGIQHDAKGMEAEFRVSQ